LELAYNKLFDVEPDSDEVSPAAVHGMATGIADMLSGIATLIGDPGVLRMPSIGEVR
jgi:hypothetical protein